MTLRTRLTLVFASMLFSLPGHSHPQSSPETQAAPERDRQAILAMAGHYRVRFQFQETVATTPGYALKEPYHSGATEFVEVVEDHGNRIVLQHILVMHPDPADKPDTSDTSGASEPSTDQGPHVVKHWRQDWVYEDTELNVYRGHRVFEHLSLTPEQARGKWSQAVYQVDDSPRYEAMGQWSHVGDRSSWVSDGETWRPLPRREHTKRDDYHVLVAKNRHTITPAGWVHEQDNYKLVLDADGVPSTVLAHESGLNVYDKVDDVDFSAGRAYWEDTRAYWQDVRELWEDVLDDSATTRVAVEVDGQPLYARLFEVAQDVRKDGGYLPAHKDRAETIIRAALSAP